MKNQSIPPLSYTHMSTTVIVTSILSGYLGHLTSIGKMRVSNGRIKSKNVILRC